MKPDKLQVGDELFAHGTAPIGEAIQYCQGSEYEHVMMYNGFKNGDHYVAQATSSGFVETKLQDAIDPAYVFVDVYRYGVKQPNNTLWLGEHFPIEPVQREIDALLAKGPGYPFIVLPFLAVICELRRIQNGPVWKNIVDEGFEYILDLVEEVPIIKMVDSVISKGDHPLDCSASCYQIFKNAGYAPVIPSGSLYDLYKDTTPKGLSNILRAMNDAMADQSGVVADFVTPKDLAESDNEIFIDKLEFGNLKRS